MFSDDEESKLKWISILNRCSMDLMLLWIERINKAIEHLDSQIKDSSIDTNSLELKVKTLYNDINRPFKEIDIKHHETEEGWRWLQKQHGISMAN